MEINRAEEMLGLMDYITMALNKYDLRFGQFISNLESAGLDFDEEFSTENGELLTKIKNIMKGD